MNIYKLQFLRVYVILVKNNTIIKLVQKEEFSYV